LLTVYDNSTGRAYAKALSEFASGSMSAAVTDPANKAFNDTELTSGDNPLPADLGATDVITATNAHIMNRLMNSTMRSTGKPAFLVQEMADVPDHVKERFRANMPAYVKNLDTIIRKAELLKTVMEVRRCDTNERINVGGEDSKKKMDTFLDALIQAAFSLRNTAAKLLKELDDQPRFMEVSEGSIESYQAMYNGMPVMPLSTLNSLVDNVPSGYLTGGVSPPEDNNAISEPWNSNVCSPYSPPGRTGFKVRYGSRYVLGRPCSTVSLDHVPWAKELLEASNGLSDARSSVDASMFGSYLQNHIELLRYVVDARQVRGKMTMWKASAEDRNPVLADTKGDNGHGIRADSNNRSRPSGYLTTLSLQDKNMDLLVSLSETSFQDRARDAMIKAVTAGEGASSRKTILVRNLLDLNVMPINVRALMRDVVFVNLYNYSYTWDHMVADMFGYHPSSDLINDCKDVPSSKLTNPRDTFVRMLVQPYQHLDYAAYYGLYSQIMAGNTGVQLGRPKFLGDQLYNKALLGELYPGKMSLMNFQQTQQPGQAGRWQNLPQNISASSAMARKLSSQSTYMLASESLSNSSNNGNGLSYLAESPSNTKKSAGSRLSQADVSGSKMALRVYGLLRFETKFARNLLFLGQLQRVMRLKLSQELSWNKRVSSGVALLDPRFTELDGDKSSHDKYESKLKSQYNY